MKKELSVIKQIIRYSEEIIIIKMTKERLKSDYFVLSRHLSVCPYIENVTILIGWLCRKEEEYMKSIRKLIKPLLNGKEFEFLVKRDTNGLMSEFFTLSSEDILNQYVILKEKGSGKDYILFLTTYTNPWETFQEGSLHLLKDEGFLEKIPRGKYSERMYGILKAQSKERSK